MTPDKMRRRVAGRIRPRPTILAEYQEVRAERNERIRDVYPDVPSLVQLLGLPDPGELTVWKVELGCGCVKESLERGDDLPTDRHREGPDRDQRLPLGQSYCLTHKHSEEEDCFRDIVEWGKRLDDHHHSRFVKRTGDFVPTDPPKYSARWEVTLSCGHTDFALVDNLDWKPGDPPTRPDISPQKRSAMIRKFTREADQYPDVRTMCERAAQWWADGCPDPHGDTMCFTCPHVQPIVAIEKVGPLVSPETPEPSKKDILTDRLRSAEAEVARIRRALDEEES